MPPESQCRCPDFLNENPFSPYQWLTFALCFFIVLLDGFDTAAIGYIAPSLITEWGVQRPALAPVLSAALFGLAFGALSSGPLADRFGRKKVLVGSVLLMGVACLSSAFAAELNHLVVWRFITGLGLGAAMPNAVTLMSEYCPDSTARDADQRHVLRLSAGCRVRRLPRGLDDPDLGLAQRADAGRRGPPDPDGAAARAAAGIGPLHGRQERSRSSASAPCFGASRHRPPMRLPSS